MSKQGETFSISFGDKYVTTSVNDVVKITNIDSNIETDMSNSIIYLRNNEHEIELTYILLGMIFLEYGYIDEFYDFDGTHDELCDIFDLILIHKALD